jgi:hypothetical protein
MIWIPLFFYSIGLSVLLGKIVKFLGRNNQPGWAFERNTYPDSAPELPNSKNLVFMCLVVLILGLSYPFMDLMIPERYDNEFLEEKLSDSFYAMDQYNNMLDRQANNEEFKIIFGRSLYPRFFISGDSMRDTGTPDYSYSRIEFYLVGTENTWVSLPSVNGSEHLPHGNDVIVLGKWEDAIFQENGKHVSGDYFRAEKIILLPPD